MPSCDCSGILKSGLGRLGIGQMPALPGTHSIIILFVVGGISMGELRAVKQAAQSCGSSRVQTIATAQRQSPTLFFGSTLLLTASGLMDALT